MRLPPGERLVSTDSLVVGHEGAAILPPLSMTIAAGELWAVIGPNGSGKSTFVRTALGLVPPVLAGLPVLAHRVVEPEAPVHLLSRQSFSAARARSSP